MNSRYIHQLPFGICSVVLGSLVVSLSLTLKCKVVKNRVWSANLMHLRLSPDHHPDIFVLMCSGSGCAVQIWGGLLETKIFFLALCSQTDGILLVFGDYLVPLREKKRRGNEGIKDERMSLTFEDMVVWTFWGWSCWHPTVASFSPHYWNNIYKNQNNTSVCLCVSFEWSRLAWGGSSSQHSKTTITHFRENHIFCVFALYWFVNVTSCSRYLISLCFYFQMTSWINGLTIHHIGIGFVCCFFHHYTSSPS